MTDLIERLRDEIEQLRVEQAQYEEEIERLRAVVDAAKVYTDSDWNNMVRVDRNFDDLCKAVDAAIALRDRIEPRSKGGIADEYYALDVALAALEDENDSL